MASRVSEMPAAEYAMMARVEDEHWWYRTLRRLVMACLAEHGIAANAVLLDAGCGTGGGLQAWSRTAVPVGIDTSSEALRHCARRGLRRVAQAAIERIPLRSASLDAVVSMDVVCLTGVDEDRALSEILRVLRPGGLLVLNLPAFEALRGQHDRAVRIRRRYRKEDVAVMLRAVGFEVGRAGYWNTVLFPLAWAIRQLRGRGGATPTSDLTVTPRALNALLVGLLQLETAIFRERAPFGTSVLAVARRPMV